MNHDQFLNAKITYYKAVEVYAQSEKTLTDMGKYIEAICAYSEAQDNHIEHLNEVLDDVKTILYEAKEKFSAYTRI